MKKIKLIECNVVMEIFMDDKRANTETTKEQLAMFKYKNQLNNGAYLKQRARINEHKNTLRLNRKRVTTGPNNSLFSS